MKKTLGLFCTALLLATASSAHAQPAARYPSKPVRIIVPFPPGGGGDFIGRIVAEALVKLTDQPHIVDNRPSSNTIIGTDFPSRSPEGNVQDLIEMGFSASDLRAIHRDNALRLLPRLRSPA